MKKTALLLLLLLLCGLATPTLAQESGAASAQLSGGGYVFVPAMEGEAERGAWITVMGRGLDAEGRLDNAPLPGVTLRLMVPDAQGELMPWPDAAGKVTEVVTRDAPVFLPVPTGLATVAEIVSAPEGYFALGGEHTIEVTQGQELTIWFQQRGQLWISLRDETGRGIGGAVARITGDKDFEQELTLPQEGQALIQGLAAGAYTLEVLSVPEGYLMPEPARYSLILEDARRTEVEIALEPMGSVAVSVLGRSLDDKGRAAWTPLPDVDLRVLDGKGRKITDAQGQPVMLRSDAQGKASAFLPAGGYRLRVEAGEAGEAGEYALAAQELEFEITDGAESALRVEGLSDLGALRLTGLADEGGESTPRLAGLRYELRGPGDEDIATGETGADGTALFTGLDSGTYTVKLSPPEGYSLPGEAEVTIEVNPAEVAEVEALCPALRQGTFTLLASVPAESGKVESAPLPGIAFSIVGEGEVLAPGRTDALGQAALTLPVGEYALTIDAAQEGLSGLLVEEGVLRWQGDASEARLPNASGRLMLSTTDGQGARLSGAVYQLQGQDKSPLELFVDERGETITPLLPAGTYTLITLESPERYARVETQVEVLADTVSFVEIPHPALGELEFTLLETAIDAEGSAYARPLAQATVELYDLDTRGRERTLLSEGWQTDAQGVLREASGALPALAEGIYRILRDGQSLDVEIRNASLTPAQLVLPGTEGAIRLTLTDSASPEMGLAAARFTLALPEGQERTLTTDATGQAVLTDLPQGVYTLRQGRAGTGYSPAEPIEIKINGGELTEAALVNHREGSLRIEKRGIAYGTEGIVDQSSLEGEFAVYQLSQGEYLPYPGAEDQAVLLAGEETALPASPEGVTYYLREKTAEAAGYLPGTQWVEAKVYSGQRTDLQVSLTADQGYFRVFYQDEDGQPLEGGRFALYAVREGITEPEPVSVFEAGQGTYLNPRGVSAGEYELRLVRAAPGTMLDASITPISWRLSVTAYSPESPGIAEVAAVSHSIPVDEAVRNARALSASPGEEGEIVVSLEEAQSSDYPLPMRDFSVTMGALSEAPQSLAWSVRRLTLFPAWDSEGKPLRAKVEALLWTGGWVELVRDLSPSEATSLLVEDYTGLAVRELRVTYSGSAAGEVSGGLHGGALQASVQVFSTGEYSPRATEAYRVRYLDEQGDVIHGAAGQVVFRAKALRVELPEPRTVAAPSIAGQVYVETGEEQLALPGVMVVLQDALGQEVARQAADAGGNYAFGDLAPGTYRVQPDPAGPDVARLVAQAQEVEVSQGGQARQDLALQARRSVRLHLDWLEGAQGFVEAALVGSQGESLSPDRQSEDLVEWLDVPTGAYDLRLSLPDTLMADEAETAFVLSADQWEVNLDRALRPASGLRGGFYLDNDGDGRRQAGEQGLSGVTVRLMGGVLLDQPTVLAETTSDAQGGFVFDRLPAGTYGLEILLPQGLRMDQEAPGSVTLSPGQWKEMDPWAVYRPMEITGTAFLDEDGDGMMGQQEPREKGLILRLYRAGEEEGLPLLSTRTNDQGGFSFSGLKPGDYLIRIPLGEDQVPTHQKEAGSQLRLLRQGLGEIGPVSLRQDQESEALLLGLSEAIELEVRAWLDERYTGVVSRSAAGVEDVAWTLVRLAGDQETEVGEAVSNATGEAVFAQLSPGTYKLRYTLAEPLAPTRQGDSTLKAVGSGFALQGETQAFTLKARQGQVSMTFGLVGPGSISGQVWLDEDDSGQRDAGEKGQSGILVEALDHSGQVAASASSDAQGGYTLTPLLPGRYTVRFTAGEGLAFSGTQRTYERGAAPRTEGPVSQTIAMDLRAGIPLEGVNAGVLPLASLTVQVLHAEEGGGPLAGAAVALEKRSNQRVVESFAATTDDGGQAVLQNLRPGEYQLRLTLPDAYVVSGLGGEAGIGLAEGERQGSALTQPFALEAGEHLGGIEFESLLLCSISGSLWDDLDGDGLPGEGEPALRGATVELLTGSGAAAEASATSDREGRFSFTGLMPGQYRLRVTLPEGRVFTHPAPGGSQPPREDTQTWVSEDISLSMGETYEGMRVGALRLASVSGIAYLDANDDGRMSGSEAGLAGVHLTLRDAAGEVRGEASSDPEGRWSLTEVEPGTYTLEAVLPEGQLFARALRRDGQPYFAGGDSTEGESEAFALTFGQEWTGVQLGAVTTGGFSGFIYDDAEDSAEAAGSGAGVAGVILTATEASTGLSYSDTTDEAGRFAIADLRPGDWSLRIELPEDRLFSRSGACASLLTNAEDLAQATVQHLPLTMGQWRHDLNFGALLPIRVGGVLYLDPNLNATRDAGEQGFEGATVALLYDGVSFAQQTTGADGAFIFPRLRPGRISLRVTLPQSAMFETGGPLTLEELTGVGGVWPQRLMRAGEDASNIGIPVLQRSSISGLVFEDVDTDGLRGSDEPMMAGVMVELINKTGTERVAASMSTDEMGRFAFDSLTPGQYSLRFTLPNGYLLTTPGQGERASQAVEVSPQVGVIEGIDLAMGQQQGAYLAGGIRPGFIGDTVWIDTNGNGLQDEGEPPLAGVTIVLYRVEQGSRQEVARTQSDSWGFYRFADLRPGEYQVQALLPEGYEFTQNVPELQEITSAIVSFEEGGGFTEVFTLRSNQQRRNMDVGLLVP